MSKYSNFEDAREGQANFYLMELDRGLRSNILNEQCQSLMNFSHFFDRYPFPIFINSAYLKLTDFFCSGYMIYLVVQKSRKHIDKIINVDQIVKRLFVLTHSNDPIARAITLNLFGTLSKILHNYSNVHHFIKESLDSNDKVELNAAFYACQILCQHSKLFATLIIQKLCVLMDNISTSIQLKLKLVVLLRYMHPYSEIVDQAITICKKALVKYPQQEFSIESMHTLTVLSKSSILYYETHADYLLSIATNDLRAQIRVKALKDFLNLTCKNSHDIITESGTWDNNGHNIKSINDPDSENFMDQFYTDIKEFADASNLCTDKVQKNTAKENIIIENALNKTRNSYNSKVKEWNNELTLSSIKIPDSQLKRLCDILKKIIGNDCQKLLSLTNYDMECLVIILDILSNVPHYTNDEVNELKVIIHDIIGKSFDYYFPYLNYIPIKRKLPSSIISKIHVVHIKALALECNINIISIGDQGRNQNIPNMSSDKMEMDEILIESNTLESSTISSALGLMVDLKNYFGISMRFIAKILSRLMRNDNTSEIIQHDAEQLKFMRNAGKHLQTLGSNLLMWCRILHQIKNFIANLNNGENYTNNPSISNSNIILMTNYNIFLMNCLKNYLDQIQLFGNAKFEINSITLKTLFQTIFRTLCRLYVDSINCIAKNIKTNKIVTDFSHYLSTLIPKKPISLMGRDNGFIMESFINYKDIIQLIMKLNINDAESNILPNLINSEKFSKQPSLYYDISKLAMMNGHHNLAYKLLSIVSSDITNEHYHAWISTLCSVARFESLMVKRDISQQDFSELEDQIYKSIDLIRQTIHTMPYVAKDNNLSNTLQSNATSYLKLSNISSTQNDSASFAFQLEFLYLRASVYQCLAQIITNFKHLEISDSIYDNIFTKNYGTTISRDATKESISYNRDIIRMRLKNYFHPILYRCELTVQLWSMFYKRRCFDTPPRVQRLIQKACISIILAVKQLLEMLCLAIGNTTEKIISSDKFLSVENLLLKIPQTTDKYNQLKSFLNKLNDMDDMNPLEWKQCLALCQTIVLALLQSPFRYPSYFFLNCQSTTLKIFTNPQPNKILPESLIQQNNIQNILHNLFRDPATYVKCSIDSLFTINVEGIIINQSQHTKTGFQTIRVDCTCTYLSPLNNEMTTDNMIQQIKPKLKHQVCLITEFHALEKKLLDMQLEGCTSEANSNAIIDCEIKLSDKKPFQEEKTNHCQSQDVAIHNDYFTGQFLIDFEQRNGFYQIYIACFIMDSDKQLWDPGTSQSIYVKVS